MVRKRNWPCPFKIEDSTSGVHHGFGYRCSKNPKKEVFEPVSKDMLTYDCKALDSLEW